MDAPEGAQRIEIWAFQLDECLFGAVFHAADAARAAAISDPLRKIRFERGRALLRRVLGLRLGARPEDIEFEILPGGKPRVAGCEFSISHSGPWLVVAASDTAVGVDVEAQRPGRDVMELAGRFFSAHDFELLRQSAGPQFQGFLRQWVAKEAALKAAGVGIANHLGRAECAADGGAIRGVRWDAESYAIHEFTLRDGTPGAVAWRGGISADVKWRDGAEANIS